MHYYKRNLGDYAKKAGRLSMLQHGAYTLLIDACYDREQFPTRTEAIDWTWASSTAEIEAVDFVLSKFFTLEEGRYVQKRIQEEIAAFHAMSETNKRIAAEREAKRKQSSTNRARVVHEAPPNQEPITKNQEPRTNNQEPKEEAPRKRSATTEAIARPDDVDAQTWTDWLALRKSKRAPVTQTVVDGARTEAQKAGMTLDAFLQVWCLRGSQGLHADWLRPDERSTVSRIPSETVYQRSMRLRMQEAAPESARKDPSRPVENVIDFFAVEVPAKRLEIGNEPATSLG